MKNMITILPKIDHQVFHKWAQLSLPRNPTIGAVGFLRLDISIIFRGDIQVLPVVVNDDRVDDNLLLPTGSEQQPANYVITVYGVFGLPNSAHTQIDYKRSAKSPSSFVRVSFCGLSVKTAVQPRNIHPTYCEQISIVEMFPNMSEMIRLDVCSGEGCLSRVLASAYLKLGQISHDGENGFLPTFGPSLLHMYGSTAYGALGTNSEDGPYHRGAMLVSLKTIVPYYQQRLRTTAVEPVVPIQPESLWLMEDFCIFCPILEASMLDLQVCGKLCGVAMTVGELPTIEDGDEEFVSMMSEIKNRKLYYTGSMEVVKTIVDHGNLDFDHKFPVLQLATRLPDFRFRMYRNNMVHGIVADLEQSLKDVERRFKNSEFDNLRDLIDDLSRAADDAAGNILKFLDIVQYSCPVDSVENAMVNYSTELDQKQMALQKEETEKIYQQITKKVKCNSMLSLIRSVNKTIEQNVSKKDVKIMLADIKTLTENLQNLIYKTSEGWPYLIIWLLNNGSRVAYSKISISDIIYSVIPEQNGRNCGRIQTIYLKPLKCSKHVTGSPSSCFCIAGKIELILWMGLYRQMHAFEPYLPNGYKLKVKDFEISLKTTTLMVECRAFIYRAKLSGNIERQPHIHTFVRINTLNTVKESKTKPKTMTPIFNQVLKVHKLISATKDRIESSPPAVLIEVFDSNLAGKQELVGRCEVHPVVDDRQSYEFAPRLKWHDMYRGMEHTGQLLMSTQIVPIPETVLKSTVYSSVEESIFPDAKIDEPEPTDVEPLPSNLIPKSATYKVDIYWWGLRDVTTSRKPCVVLEIDELVMKSDVVSDKKPNCNFPNGRSSQTFEASLNEMFYPPLSIRLYDSSTFGRTLFLGTNIVKNPNKYVVSWIPKVEREASLRSVSICASNFFQVNQMLFIKKGPSSECSEYLRKESMESQLCKRSTWKKMFCSTYPNEEEFVLLPISVKEKDINISNKSLESIESKDWWTRYFSSMEVEFDEKVAETDKITLYHNELESQLEFSKFKDWCTTLKLYNGHKTGIPEKDEQLYCGFLKAGIAIYKWPPPDDTVAVTCDGVDLGDGYFKNYPVNEPKKFLVRAYILKADNLVSKGFTDKLDPYLAISCGNKQLGDRKSHVKNTLNPVFGKMYEFRCILPEDYLLTVSLYDYDALPPDELIGSTTIDLEDRIYSKHRAMVGLASEYNSTGLNKWRDCNKPSVILEELCERNHLPPPIFPDSATVIVNGVEYRDTSSSDRSFKSASEKKENICLSLLHRWHTLPICGYHLVPEHVETRTLYNAEKPGLDLGKLQMWVDIFPLDSEFYIPPAVNITPRKLEKYELRVVVWDVQGIQFKDPLKKASDIYVRAWVDTIEQAQYTDVHHRSVAGEGSFNWRMIFRFQYHHAEKKLVRSEKGPFTEVEDHVPPIFVVQVLDSNSNLQQDFLATLSFNLNAIPKGMKLARMCQLDNMDKLKKINLFSIMSINGWWPLVRTDRDTGMNKNAGFIRLEMTLLPKEKAVLMPVGMGREPPSPLPHPNRSQLSNPMCFVQSMQSKFQSHPESKPILGAGFLIVLTLLLMLYFELPTLIWNRLIEDRDDMLLDSVTELIT